MKISEDQKWIFAALSSKRLVELNKKKQKVELDKRLGEYSREFKLEEIAKEQQELRKFLNSL